MHSWFSWLHCSWGDWKTTHSQHLDPQLLCIFIFLLMNQRKHYILDLKVYTANFYCSSLEAICTSTFSFSPSLSFLKLHTDDFHFYIWELTGWLRLWHSLLTFILEGSHGVCHFQPWRFTWLNFTFFCTYVLYLKRPFVGSHGWLSPSFCSLCFIFEGPYPQLTFTFTYMFTLEGSHSWLPKKTAWLSGHPSRILEQVGWWWLWWCWWWHWW